MKKPEKRIVKAASKVVTSDPPTGYVRVLFKIPYEKFNTGDVVDIPERRYKSLHREVERYFGTNEPTKSW